jgi:Darcynin, domain of unknown function
MATTVATIHTPIAADAPAIPPTVAAEPGPTKLKGYTVFMRVKTTPEWLALAPSKRFAFLATDIEPLVKRHPAVQMRFQYHLASRLTHQPRGFRASARARIRACQRPRLALKGQGRGPLV